MFLSLRYGADLGRSRLVNFCSGFRWTAALEGVQRNPLTNAVTLQSIPFFCRFVCSEFRCNALDSTMIRGLLFYMFENLVHDINLILRFFSFAREITNE